MRARGGDEAAQFIGQGKVTATPLFMASVATTVRAGEFRQPIIPAGTQQVSAPRPITPLTAGWLRDLLRTTATRGTAAARLGDLPGSARRQAPPRSPTTPTAGSRRTTTGSPWPPWSPAALPGRTLPESSCVAC
ncbi:hypothetical protein ACW14X_26975 [Nocardioides sp. YJ-D4]